MILNNNFKSQLTNNYSLFFNGETVSTNYIFKNSNIDYIYNDIQIPGFGKHCQKIYIYNK